MGWKRARGARVNARAPGLSNWVGNVHALMRVHLGRQIGLGILARSTKIMRVGPVRASGLRRVATQIRRCAPKLMPRHVVCGKMLALLAKNRKSSMG